jgi:hypothetical protein
MVGNLSQVFSTHFLGVLFVDEIQCLMLRGDEEAKLALSLFLKIANVCRVPIVFSGTYAAVKLFSKVARNARRVCSGGYFDLALATSYDDVLWDKLIVALIWNKYQWVPEPAPLTEALRKQLFGLTRGILAVFIALHRASQVYAIRRGLKTVDGSVLKKVYDEQFVLLHPALDALGSNKKNRLEKFEDLLPPKDQLDTLLRPSRDELFVDRLQRLMVMGQDAAMESQAQSPPPKPGRTASNASELPAEPPAADDASRAAAQLLNQIGSNPELKELARRAGLIGEDNA